MSENPYLPPSSDVAPIRVALSLADPPFSSEYLRVSGWLSLVLIVLNVVYLAESFVPELFATSVTVALGVSTILLSIYLTYVLVRYLEYRYEAANLRVLFYVLVVVSVLMGIADLLSVGDASDELSYSMIALIVAMPIYGIPYAMFGFRIKQFAKDSPLLNTLAWLTIATGILISTIIFAMLAVPLSLASDVVFAMLLFAVAREISESGYA